MHIFFSLSCRDDDDGYYYYYYYYYSVARCSSVYFLSFSLNIVGPLSLRSSTPPSPPLLFLCKGRISSSPFTDNILHMCV